MRKILLLLAVLALLVGCADQEILPTDDPLQPGAIEGRFDMYNRFGFHLYNQLVEQENIMISPISIGLALAMTYNGADGETREEMARALQLESVDLAAFNQKNQELLRLLSRSDVTLSIANSLWLRQGIPLRGEFVAANREFYQAEVSELDFNDPASVQTINNWVAEQTNGLIKEIIEGPIDPLTLLFLINAIYFQGDWAQPFDEGLTRDDQFQTPGGSVETPFMHKAGNYSYLATEDFQAIRLPYGEGSLAMYVFLPQDLAAFHRQLTPENWQRWLSEFAISQGRLALPKFEFGYEAELNDALRALGMKTAFEPGQADFSQMIDADVSISKVKHKSFIKVNEQGAEAAAVTSVEVRVTSVMPPQEMFEMKVDRPFCFIIHDSQTDTILFLGSVVDPS